MCCRNRAERSIVEPGVECSTLKWQCLSLALCCQTHRCFSCVCSSVCSTVCVPPFLCSGLASQWCWSPTPWRWSTFLSATVQLDGTPRDVTRWDNKRENKKRIVIIWKFHCQPHVLLGLFFTTHIGLLFASSHSPHDSLLWLEEFVLREWILFCYDKVLNATRQYNLNYALKI